MVPPNANTATADELLRQRTVSSLSIDKGTSAVSWGAIFAGAAAATVLSLVLLILGTGLGLSSVSPWANEGVSATTIAVSTIIWITLTQLLASGMGGYIAGRLRTKWGDAARDEVYFRDTAHGFLAWAVATLITAVLLTSTVGAILSGGVKAGAAVAGSVATSAGVAATGAASAMAANGNNAAQTATEPASYFVDSLFRKNSDALQSTATTGAQVNNAAQDNAAPAEVSRIFMNSIRTGNLPAEDASYVAQLVAARTGLTQQEAEKRVNDTYVRLQTKLRDAETAAREAADKARKTSAYTSLWLTISLLIGAFVASFTATYGGRRRDF